MPLLVGAQAAAGGVALHRTGAQRKEEADGVTACWRAVCRLDLANAERPDPMDRLRRTP